MTVRGAVSSFRELSEMSSQNVPLASSHTDEIVNNVAAIART
jgi:hypothetical protein